MRLNTNCLAVEVVETSSHNPKDFEDDLFGCFEANKNADIVNISFQQNAYLGKDGKQVILRTAIILFDISKDCGEELCQEPEKEPKV